MIKINKTPQAIFLLLAIIAFYVGGASMILKAVTYDIPVPKDMTLLSFETGYAPFLGWVATSYSALVVSLVFIIYSRNKLCALPNLGGIGLFFYLSLSTVSILLLWCIGTASFEAVEPYLCFSERVCQKNVFFDPYKVTCITKFTLNAAFQMAAIGLLCGFIFTLADNDNDDEKKQKTAMTLFYCAALLLTLIVLTDLLFYEFIELIAPEVPAILTIQKGIVIFLAIISSASLGIALLAGVVLDDEALKVALGEVAEGQTTGTVSTLISSAGFSRSLAALAPVILPLLMELGP